MTEPKISAEKEYDVYRDSLFRYLGSFLFYSIKNLMMQFLWNIQGIIIKFIFFRILQRTGGKL